MQGSSVRVMGACLLMICAAGITSAGCGDDGRSSSRRRDNDEEDMGVTSGGSSGSASPCMEGEYQCDGTNILEECVNSTWEGRSCTERCEEIGFSAVGCSGDQCSCNEPLNASCVTGMAAYCVCRESATGEVCTDDEKLGMYVSCYQNEPDGQTIFCFSLYVDGNQVDCDGAVAGCL